MKIQICLLLCGAVAVVLSRPSNDIVDFETDNMEVEQEGVPGKAVTGEYSWTAPNGEDFHVKYTADHRGFRVHETDAVATFKDAGLPADVQGDDDAEEVEAEEDEGDEESEGGDEEEEEEEKEDDSEE